MEKVIAIRGKKNLVAVFSKYAQISGQQDTSRPRAAEAFINFVGDPLADQEELVGKLKRAAKQHIDEGGTDAFVPNFIKIIVDVDEDVWERAMEVFRRAFLLKNNPQMPFFIRVAGTAFLADLEENDQDLVQPQKALTEENVDAFELSLEQFQALSTDAKLDALYSLLLVIRQHYR